MSEIESILLADLIILALMGVSFGAVHVYENGMPRLLWLRRLVLRLFETRTGKRLLSWSDDER